MTPLTGVFSFANRDNPEVFVKVLGPVGAGSQQSSGDLLRVGKGMAALERRFF